MYTLRRLATECKRVAMRWALLLLVGCGGEVRNPGDRCVTEAGAAELCDDLRWQWFDDDGGPHGCHEACPALSRCAYIPAGPEGVCR